MKLSDHCKLCAHQSVTLKDGTVCGLTNRKPEFNSTCTKIEFTNAFEESLKEVNVDLFIHMQLKLWTYAYVALFSVASIAVFIGTYSFTNYISKMEIMGNAFGLYYSTVIPIFFIVIGIILLGIAIGQLNGFKNKKEILLNRKQKVDAVLDLYRIKYSIDIALGKKYHGKQESIVTLDINGDKKRVNHISNLNSLRILSKN